MLFYKYTNGCLKMGKVKAFIFLAFFLATFFLVVLFFNGKEDESQDAATARSLYDSTKLTEQNDTLEQSASSCKFGFDFLEDMIAKKSSMEPKKLLLPEHKKVNFSGALISQDFLCLDTMDANVNQSIGIFECHGQGRNQAIMFTTEGFIRSSRGSKTLCIATKDMKSHDVVMKTCNILDETQFWTTDGVNGFIKPTSRQNYCLRAPKSGNVRLQPCKGNTKSVKWKLVMKEVLQLWIEGLPSDLRTELKKKNKGMKRIKNLMIQNKENTLPDSFFI